MTSVEIMVTALKDAKTSEEMDRALAGLNNLSNRSEDEKLAFSEILIAKLSESDIMNAKLRRRIKRLIESANESPTLAIEEKSDNFIKSTTSITVVEAVDILKACSTQHDVENTLNCFILPDVKEFKFPELKLVLQDLEKQIFINKIIRRRISRLIFALSDEDEKKELKIKQAAFKNNATLKVEQANKNPPKMIEKVFVAYNSCVLIILYIFCIKKSFMEKLLVSV